MANLCPTSPQSLAVADAADALVLAEAVDCVGDGSFAVDWVGRVKPQATIYVPNGVYLNISGSSSAIIDGDDRISLFNVSAATLLLSNVSIRHGNGTTGGAISATGSSNVTVVDCGFMDNKASVCGGAIHIEESMLKLEGNNSFTRNNATFWGGALAMDGASLVVDGDTTFGENTSGRGAAIAAMFYCDVNFTGHSRFVDNVATVSGGAGFGLYSALNFLPREGVGSASFVGNRAESEFGGAFYWRGEDDSSFVFEVPAVFVNNSAPTGGALYLAGRGLIVVLANIHFESNSAEKNGGAVVTSVVGLRQASAEVVNCSFEGNTAALNGGAVVISTGFVTATNSSFTGNVAGKYGGAILCDGSYTVSEFQMFECQLSENRALQGPAIAQDATTDAGTAWTVTFEAVTFTENVLLCDVDEFLLPYSNDSVSETDLAYYTACFSCPDMTECLDCIVEDAGTVALCTTVYDHTTSTEPYDTIASLSLANGFWRTSNTSKEILECHNADACVGGAAPKCGGVNCEEGYCADGYTGPYCAVCAEDYTWGREYTCVTCKGGTARATETIAIAVFVVLLAVLYRTFVYLTSGVEQNTSNDRPSTFQKCASRCSGAIPLQAIKILIVAWQIISEFSSVANVSFPSYYQKFLSVVEIVNLNLAWVVSMVCYFDTNFYDRLLAITITPFLMLGLLTGTYWIAQRRYKWHSQRMSEIRRRHLSVLILITFLVYSSASSTIFRTFACDYFDDGGAYLRADYRLRCHQGGRDTVEIHRAYMVYAGIMIVIYPIGIPVFYGTLLYNGWRHQAQSGAAVAGMDESCKTNELSRQCDSGGEYESTVRDLWKPYKKDRFYYEVVECVRRVMLTGVVVFVFPDSAAQISTTFLLALFFFALSEVLNPYESSQDCWMSRFGHLVVLLSMFVALLLKVDVQEESRNGQDMYAVVLIIANVSMMLAIIGESFVSMYYHVKGSDE